MGGGDAGSLAGNERSKRGAQSPYSTNSLRVTPSCVIAIRLLAIPVDYPLYATILLPPL